MTSRRPTLILFALLALWAGSAFGDPPTLRVMSWNILYDSPKWGAGLAWSIRQPGASALLAQHRPDIAGFQEVLGRQLLDLQTMLPDYDFVGNVPGPTIDPELPWVMNPVFFRRDRLRVLDTGFWWLMGTDDNGIPRTTWPEEGIVLARPAHGVWIRFLDLQGGQSFYLINLHYPPHSDGARRKAAIGLVAGIRQLSPGLPLIVTGDFNSAIEVALGDLAATGLVDSRALSETKPAGPASTRVDRRTGEIRPSSVDHILVSPGIQVPGVATLADKFGARHPSDHLPVLARLVLP